MKTTLYLARHGQTQWNKVQRFQGQLDSELTAIGKQQSENVASQLISKKIDLAILCGERIYQALKSLALSHKSKNLLVIFHGEALRCLLARLGENSTGNAYQLFDNGCLLSLNYLHQDNQFQLVEQL